MPSGSPGACATSQTGKRTLPPSNGFARAGSRSSSRRPGETATGSPTNALTRGFRDLVLPFFLEMGIENARKAYSYTVDWDEKVAQGKLYRKV
jgi:hypothetical protein